MDITVGPPGHYVHSPYLDEQIHTQADAHKEHDCLHHLVLQRTSCTEVDRLVAHDKLAVEHLIEHPQHAQHTQGTQERRQEGDAMKRGDKPEASYANQQHGKPLPGGKHVVIATIDGTGTLDIQVVGQFPAYQQHGNHRSHHGRKNERSAEIGGGDSSTGPHNQRRDITDNRETAATIGSNDNGRAQEKTLMAVIHKFAQNHQHHHASGEIVDIGAHDECEEHQACQHTPCTLRPTP